MWVGLIGPTHMHYGLRILRTFPIRIQRLIRAIGVGAVLLVAMPFPQTASSALPDVQLSITLTNGTDAVTDGDSVTYTAEIRNSGAAVDARIVLAPPAYVTLGVANGAVVDENQATWSLLLEGGSTTTVELPAKVAEIPDGELRVTTLASVYVEESTAPVIRTAVANDIEGVADEQVVTANSTPLVLWIGIGVVLVLAATAAMLLVLRSRRAKSKIED